MTLFYVFSDETRGFLSDTSHYDEDWHPHPSGIILKRVDYYTIPSLDDLEHLVGDDGSCIVDNFCVGRINYGNLYFDETMDVSGLNIDEIVHFRHKEVNVYPDDDKKPPVGSGLNRKCQVTLEQVWPVDKTTREPIKDPERLLTMKYEEKLRRSTAKMGATFVEYRPVTGSWVFKVDHFSKYGLTDSDEEEVDDKAPVAGSKLQLPVKQVTASKPTQTPSPIGQKQAATTVLSPILPTKQLCTSLADTHATFTIEPKDKTFPAGDLGLDIDEEMDEDDGNEENDLLESFEATGGDHLSPSIHLARRAGIDSHRVQLMKASLFEKENEEFEDINKLDTMGYVDYPMLEDMQVDDVKLPRGLHTLRARFKQAPRTITTQFDLKGLEFKPEVPVTTGRFSQIPTILRAPRPKTVSVVHCGNVLPYSKSTIAKLNARCLADIGIFMGRSFRNGWGPRTSMTCLSTLWRSEYANGDVYFCMEGRTGNDTSPSVVQRLMIYNKDSPDLFKVGLKVFEIDRVRLGYDKMTSALGNLMKKCSRL